MKSERYPSFSSFPGLPGAPGLPGRDGTLLDRSLLIFTNAILFFLRSSWLSWSERWKWRLVQRHIWYMSNKIAKTNLHFTSIIGPRGEPGFPGLPGLPGAAGLRGLVSISCWTYSTLLLTEEMKIIEWTLCSLVYLAQAVDAEHPVLLDFLVWYSFIEREFLSNSICSL